MMILRDLTASLLGVSLACAALQVSAQEKPRPSKVEPLDAFANSELSAPAVDAPQAVDLDVSVPSKYVPITPCRVADTRVIEQRFGLPFEPGFAGGETMGFWGWVGEGGTYIDFGGFDGECGIPSTATAVHMNISVVDARGKGFLRAWPNNTGEPASGTIVSWNVGDRNGNAVTVAICSDSTNDPEGEGFLDCLDDSDNIVDFWVKIYSSKPEHIAIDAFGYYEPI